jgi:hypothetical protein
MIIQSTSEIIQSTSEIIQSTSEIIQSTSEIIQQSEIFQPVIFDEQAFGIHTGFVKQDYYICRAVLSD